MKKHFTYCPTGTCSRQIDFDIDTEGRVHNVCFAGGCNGNLQGLARLAEGIEATRLADTLAGVDCKGRGTSCPDQLAAAIRAAVAE